MSSTEYARKQTDTLLGMYKEYKRIADEQRSLASQLAKAKLKKQPVDALQSLHDHASRKMQSISESMTFASPLIWMMYKFEAYQDEAQPILTMHDFRLHCSKPGYICTKRFEFVNAELAYRQLAPLSDSRSYPDDMLLSGVYKSLRPLIADDMFMSIWSEREYYKTDGRVAKWENV